MFRDVPQNLNPACHNPEDLALPIGRAARIMRQHRVGGLAVVVGSRSLINKAAYRNPVCGMHEYDWFVTTHIKPVCLRAPSRHWAGVFKFESIASVLDKAFGRLSCDDPQGSG